MAETESGTRGHGGGRQPGGPARPAAAWRWLAWSPVLFFALVLVVGVAARPTAAFDPPWLLAPLNFVFLTALPILIAWLAVLAYLRTGVSAILAIGAGMLAVGLGSGLVPAILLYTRGPDATVQMHNCGALVAGAFLFTASLSGARTRPFGLAGPRWAHIVLSYGMIVIVIGGVFAVILAGMMPTFFVQGQGPTLIRQIVLGVAMAFFAASALLWWQTAVRTGLGVLRWCAIGTATFAVGLAGIFLQTSLGSLVSWVGRVGQFVAPLYLLAAVLWARGTAGGRLPESFAVAVRQSSLAYRPLLESVAEAVVVLDPDERILYWNDAAVQLFGWDGGEIFGTDLATAIADETQRPAVRANMAALATAIPDASRSSPADDAHEQLFLTGLDGRRFPAEMSFFRETTGRLRTTVCVIQDITRRWEAERTLRDSRTYYRGLIEASLDGLVTVDADLVITDVNRGLCHLLGRSRDELVGSSFPDHFTEPRRAAQAVRETLARGQISDYELTLARDPVLVSLNAATYTDPITGQVRGIFAAARDITAHRRAEDEVLRLNIQRRDDALEASRLKSEFLATMSHEIRTPMNGVVGLTGLLLNTELDELQRRYAESIETSGRLLVTIINDILDISKIEAGGVRLERTEFSLSETLESVVDLLGEDARAKNIGLGSYYSPELPDAVVGDPMRVRQVLVNLVGNAIKFTEHGGVTVLVEPAPDDDRRDPDVVRVRLEVIDTGIGISSEDLSRLFAPFAQGTPSPTRRPGGTGLGLVISKHLVEMMGGILDVRSELNVGSTFWCVVPLGRTGTTTAAPRPDVVGRRVLLVEPDEAVRSTLDRYLSDWGARVDIVDTATRTMELLRTPDGPAVAADLAIVDRRLPDGDGLAVVDQWHRTMATPVLLLSAPGRDEAAIDGGAHTVLYRPVRRDQLRECLIAGLSATPVGLDHEDGDR